MAAYISEITSLWTNRHRQGLAARVRASKIVSIRQLLGGSLQSPPSIRPGLVKEGEHHVAEYQLYCFAQSGNAYRAALMLNLIGADWEPIWIDFFVKGETRKPEFRHDINEMG